MEKNDYNVWKSGSEEHTGGMTSYKYDGATMTLTWNASGNKAMHFQISSGMTRGQVSTVNSYDVTDFSKMQAGIWCNYYANTDFEFFAGIIKDRSAWISNTNQIRGNVKWSSSSAYQNVSVDISKYTGNYYVSVQMLANSVGGFGCFNDYVTLYGQTYSYSNQS